MVTIFFNENNIDSLLAVHILRDMLINTEPETEVKLCPYDRVLDNFTLQACKKCYLIGVSLRQKELETQFSCSDNVISYAYDDQDLNATLTVLNSHHPYKDGTEVEKVFDRSLSKMLMFNNEIQMEHFGSDYVGLADVVFKYVNFIKMSKEELELFFQYQEAIKDSHLKPFSKLKPDTNLKTFTDHYVFRTTRKIVARNMDSQLFGDSSKNKLLVSVNLNQEYLIDAVRQIQYAHNSVVLYEDIKHFRQWCIYARDKKLAREIAGLIPHIEMWEDNLIVYLISEQASFVK